ncbi:MAG: class B sortase [Clostridia bacterium]|nr:class B sortase [Clostridia bacterium]
MKRKQLKRIRTAAFVLAAVMLIVTAAFCLGNLITHDAEVHRQEAIFNELAETAEESSIVESAPDGEEETLSQFETLLGKNSDMVGWIFIEGTSVNYPVMQTKNSPNYYLKRNFNREYSDLGVPYVQENCDLATSDNIIIYGHHIKGGKMFGSLDKFTSKSFYDKHKIIQFNTLTEQREYQIIAVFKTIAYSASGFRYYDFVNAEDEAHFNEYVGRCKELALYDTGVTAKYGDKLLTLSTCKRFAENGRLVVVAKKIG